MKQFLFLCLLSTLSFNIDNSAVSQLDFNELISHADIVLSATAIDLCQTNQSGDEAYVQFKIDTAIKGNFTGDLCINSQMLYKGDIAQSLKTLEHFTLSKNYLLFLQKKDDSVILLNQHTLRQHESKHRGMYMHIANRLEDVNSILYNKSELLFAIEDFVYNETEILTSEIIVSE